MSRMPSNESVIPSVSVSAITKLNGKKGIVSYWLVVVGRMVTLVIMYYHQENMSVQ